MTRRPRLSPASAATALCLALAAGPAQAQFNSFIKFGDIKGESADRPHGGEIDVLSFSWGPATAAPPRGFVKSWSTSGDADDGPAEAPGGQAGASQTLTVGGNRTESVGTAIGGAIGSKAGDGNDSAQATGERRHGPVRLRNPGEGTLAEPRPRGSVRVKVRFPWAACETGKAYPKVILGDGARRYELSDAVVSGCGTGGDTVTLNYARVGVRGWDPKKKEE